MTVRIGATRLNQAVNKFLAGNGAIQIFIYTGAQPATGDATATGTLLCTFSGMFVMATGAILSLDTFMSTVTVPASATGTAGWCRMSFPSTSYGTAVIDGSVGISGSGATFIISSTDITSGEEITISSIAITLPG
jgi:hypothetical protein